VTFISLLVFKMPILLWHKSGENHVELKWSLNCNIGKKVTRKLSLKYFLIAFFSFYSAKGTFALITLEKLCKMCHMKMQMHDLKISHLEVLRSHLIKN